MLAKVFARLAGVPLERLLVAPVVSVEEAPMYNWSVLQDVEAFRRGDTLLVVRCRDELLFVDNKGLEALEQTASVTIL